MDSWNHRKRTEREESFDLATVRNAKKLRAGGSVLNVITGLAGILRKKNTATEVFSLFGQEDTYRTSLPGRIPEVPELSRNRKRVYFEHTSFPIHPMCFGCKIFGCLGSPDSEDNPHTFTLLGEGSYAKVWKVDYSTGESRALKIFRDRECRVSMIREICCLSTLSDHPNIVRMFGNGILFSFRR
jgi:hypothetical protein